MILQISGVWASGLAEGASHVNWRKVAIISFWFFGSIIPIFLATAALLAQGMGLCPVAEAVLQGNWPASERFIEYLLEDDPEDWSQLPLLALSTFDYCKRHVGL